MFGDGNQAMQPVFVEDVGRVVATCATKTEAANQLFELGGPEVMSMNDVLRAGLEAKGRKRPILHQPMFVGRLIGSIMSRLPITPPLTADAVEFIAAPAVADTANLQRVLAPELTPVRVGLGTYLKR
jgi:NADH dehydrogenase